MKNFLLITLFFLTGEIIFAQTTNTDSLQNASDNKGVFKINGYVDVNYFANLNNPQNGSNLGASGFERGFDQKAGQFQLGLAQTKFSYTRKKTEAIIDLVFGPHADLGNYGNLVGPLGSTTSLAIKQAYFNWKPTDKLVLTAGQFGTHFGYEYIDAPLNFHYTLNNLFVNGPFYHTGIKAAYAINTKLNWMVGLVNNWDNLYDNNKFKTVISQFSYIPNDRVSFYLNYIGGNEASQLKFNAKDSLKSFKQALDLVASFQLTPKFNVGFNGVFGQLGQTIVDKRERTNWGGASVYLRYAFTDKFNLGTRFDFLDNTQGVQYIKHKAFAADPSATIGTNVYSGTLTGMIKLDEEHLVIKPEIRFDQYKKVEYSGTDVDNIQQFMDKNGHYTKSSQVTVGIAVIYKY